MITARHYRQGRPVRVEIADGTYRAFAPATDDDAPWILPGLVDVQVNGFGGVDFNAPGLGPEQWAAATDALYANGCTHVLPTLLTQSDEAMTDRLREMEICRATRPANVIGYHLEGPFLNPDPGSRGCHPVAFMRAPDDAWLEAVTTASGDSIRLVTLAPEVHPEASRAFIRIATQRPGTAIRIAIGHSLAKGADLTGAVEAGATGWTHLGNAAPHEAHKFDNVLLHALAADGLLAVSLIPDGIHVPPHAFRALARALGPRLILTTDAMAGAAAAPGRYTLGPVEADVLADGRAVVPGTEKLAGSTLAPFDGVLRAAEMAGVPWRDMWDAFSVRPAAWLGFDHGLEVGHPASFCLVQDTPKGPRLQAVWHNGRPVFEAKA